MENFQNINADSGSDEYFTPVEIVQSARKVMGGIDLDPASSLAANEKVQAGRIFTLADDGLKQQWGGAGMDESPVWKDDKQAMDSEAVRGVCQWPGCFGCLYLFCINIRTVVQAIVRFSTMLYSQAHKLFSAGWNIEEGCHQRKRSYLPWHPC